MWCGLTRFMLFICGMESTGFENISFDFFELLAVILKTACERLQIFGSFQQKQCKQVFENFINRVVHSDRSEL